ncbi:MAG TPA: biopolymer transporter ExbD [Waddliaceae bacterium]
MKRRFKRYEEIEDQQVNLTPLIDVVFTILIMFIVIAPLLELDRVELAEARRDIKMERISVEAGPIIIHVHRDNSVWLNQQQLVLSSLLDLLKQKRLQYPQARPQLYHDKQAYFGTYQVVKNAVEAAGFEEMDVILKP